MFLSHIADKGFIEVISGRLDRGADYSTAERDDCDIRSTASDIYDHISACLGDIDSGTDCCCNRLFDNADLTGTCLVSRILYGLSLNFRCTARDADCDTRFSQGSLSDRFVDEIF